MRPRVLSCAARSRMQPHHLPAGAGDGSTPLLIYRSTVESRRSSSSPSGKRCDGHPCSRPAARFASRAARAVLSLGARAARAARAAAHVSTRRTAPWRSCSTGGPPRARVAGRRFYLAERQRAGAARGRGVVRRERRPGDWSRGPSAGPVALEAGLPRGRVPDPPRRAHLAPARCLLHESGGGAASSPCEGRTSPSAASERDASDFGRGAKPPGRATHARVRDVFRGEQPAPFGLLDRVDRLSGTARPSAAARDVASAGPSCTLGTTPSRSRPRSPRRRRRPRGALPRVEPEVRL